MSTGEDARLYRLPRDLYERIAQAAKRDYPEETCGLLFGTGNDLELVEMENIQNRLHTEDPEYHPRDARKAYCFDARELLRVLEEHEQARKPLSAIYHSHPDVGAYFSETDSAAAAPFGEPSYPGVVYLVASVKNGVTDDLKAFDWSPEEERYVEIGLRVE